MAEHQELKEVEDLLKDERRVAWMDEHLPELRQSISSERLLYQSLIICVVVGLVAQVAGYLLLSSAPNGLLGLLADLLHALGWSLWTGAVVVVFLQVIPGLKQRRVSEALDAYEAMRREKDQAAGDEPQSGSSSTS